MAARTLTAYVTVGQEMACLRVVELLADLFYELAGIVHLAEIVGRKLMVDGGGGTRIDVERDTEVGKRALDELVIAIDDLLGSDALFACANSDGHTVFVATADVHHFLSFQTQITGVDVSRNVDTGEVTDMHRAICIRQCSGD